MAIKINKRLLCLSAFIQDKEKVIDIGCDHGLLGIYLYQTKKEMDIISSDINSLPLKKARDNLIKYNLLSKITLLKGDGLECIDNKRDTIIISGMGGETIIKILKDINKYPTIKKIVISPNNEFPLTRKKITKLGFSLIRETMVKENNKYYLISEYKRGHSKTNYYFGKLDFSQEEVYSYYNDLEKKQNIIIKNIPHKYFVKRLNLKYRNILIRKKLQK